VARPGLDRTHHITDREAAGLRVAAIEHHLEATVALRLDHFPDC
jgi:hypothetical protein